MSVLGADGEAAGPDKGLGARIRGSGELGGVRVEVEGWEKRLRGKAVWWLRVRALESGRLVRTLTPSVLTV